MHEPFGLVRLVALPAPDVCRARTALALYAVEPLSSATVALSVAGLAPGDTAGLILCGDSRAWIGVERTTDGVVLSRFDERSGTTSRAPLEIERVWLRAECDLVGRAAAFSYSADGTRYLSVGEPVSLGGGSTAPCSVRCSLFACTTEGCARGGYADFDSFLMITPRAPRRDDGR